MSKIYRIKKAVVHPYSDGIVSFLTEESIRNEDINIRDLNVHYTKQSFSHSVHVDSTDDILDEDHSIDNYGELTSFIEECLRLNNINKILSLAFYKMKGEIKPITVIYVNSNNRFVISGEEINIRDKKNVQYLLDFGPRQWHINSSKIPTYPYSAIEESDVSILNEEGFNCVITGIEVTDNNDIVLLTH